jgi:tetratricopeptide (TPR) repeat protein
MWGMKIRAIAVSLWIVSILAPLPAAAQSASAQQQVASHAQKAAEYLREKRPDLAAPEFQAIVALEPKNVDARANLGVLLFFQGKYSDAIPQLREALKLQPALWKIQALLGIAEKRTRDVKAALGDLEKAFPNVQEEKIRIETGMELIEIYSGTGDLDKAAAVVSALRELEPTDEAVLYTAYRIYSDLAAESMLTMAIVAPKSARMHQAMAHELAKHGDTAEAIENYRVALKIDPQLSGLHFELAEMLNTSSVRADQEEAESEYKKALAVNPSDASSESRLGEIAARRNDLDEAYKRYARALELRPDDAEASLGLAKVLMTMGQPQKAEGLLEHVVQLDPTSAVAHFRLSTVYRQTGRTADAKHELEEYQKYKEMKEKLRDIFHAMRVAPAAKVNDETDPRK